MCEQLLHRSSFKYPQRKKPRTVRSGEPAAMTYPIRANICHHSLTRYIIHGSAVIEHVLQRYDTILSRYTDSALYPSFKANVLSEMCHSALRYSASVWVHRRLSVCGFWLLENIQNWKYLFQHSITFSNAVEV